MPTFLLNSTRMSISLLSFSSFLATEPNKAKLLIGYFYVHDKGTNNGQRYLGKVKGQKSKIHNHISNLNDKGEGTHPIIT